MEWKSFFDKCGLNEDLSNEYSDIFLKNRQCISIFQYYLLLNFMIICFTSIFKYIKQIKIYRR